ncbi:ATP-binding protein [Streptomyces sp. NPDC005529]|uniref:ATP-binding protein n=1 Tax=unclassified Streptomyces TaxID=2593676 RepID=UPI0033B06753
MEQACMWREPWNVAFLAEPEEVSGLRRIVRFRLERWGLREATDAAQLCVSELVSNIITHIGPGTPATLAVSMNGVRLRIEVRDPDARALPTLLDATADSEGGRGMALVDAVADRWGVELGADHKVTWCELETDLAHPEGHAVGLGTLRAMALLGFYGAGCLASGPRKPGRGAAEESAIAAITDFLHWTSAHGCDADEVLDRAQARFEADVEAPRMESRVSDQCEPADSPTQVGMDH